MYIHTYVYIATCTVYVYCVLLHVRTCCVDVAFLSIDSGCGVLCLTANCHNDDDNEDDNL